MTAGRGGRPRKASAPRNAAQAALAIQVEAAEVARDLAQDVAHADPSPSKLRELLIAEVVAHTAWAAYLRAQGNHTYALRYVEHANKLWRQILAADELDLSERLAALQSQLDALEAAAQS